jgi:uncharacterized protein (TIGR00255 family)
MIYSLTGFGRGEVVDDDLRYSVELRSVNNRYLEVSTKLPRTLMSYEMEIKALIRKYIDRGKVSIFVQESRDSLRKGRMNFDNDAAKGMVETLREMAKSSGIKDDLSLSNMIHLLDWFSVDEDAGISKRRLNLVLKGIEVAIKDFDKMRADEGANLEKDFIDRIEHINEVVSLIETKAGQNRDGSLEKLRERIEKYVPAEKVDPGRLEQEVAHIIDRLDTTEEVVRLRSHNKLFLDALKKGGSVGKRLNFILQEMNREINTIGSKASDAEVASWVVEAKEELEKIREQVQNVT